MGNGVLRPAIVGLGFKGLTSGILGLAVAAANF
jgi:hypothetical protein